MKKKKIKFIASVAYMAFIFYLSSIPNLKEPYVPFDPYKLSLHFAEYAVLGSLLYGLFKNSLGEIFVGVIYGISDEIHQRFVPGRFCDPLDALADSLGVIAGWFFYLYLIRKFSRNSLIGRWVRF